MRHKKNKNLSCGVDTYVLTWSLEKIFSEQNKEI